METKELRIRYCNLVSWPTLFIYVALFVKGCDYCLRMVTISRHEMSLNNILEVKIFDVWGIDSMGPFPSSRGN